MDARNLRPISWSNFALAWLATTGILFALSLPQRIHAVEPAEEFLKALQERGLNELALDYLEQMKSSKAVDEEFRKQIPYHRGAVLLDKSRRAVDPAERNRLLEQARSELQKFVDDNQENVSAADANLQLANVEVARAQQLLAEAAQLPKEGAYDARRKQAAGEARSIFARARDTFKRAEAIYAAAIDKLPPATDDSKAGEGTKRQEYRARVAQLRFLAAQMQFETAQTYAPNDNEYASLHADAAKELAGVHDEFARTFIVGLYARLFEGRCYLALAQYQQALGCFDELLGQPNVLPPFRKLVASAVHRKAELLVAQDKLEEAIAACQASLRDAKNDEESQPEWIAVRFRLAEALAKKAQPLAPGSLDQRKISAEARESYRLVADKPSEYQSAARMALASLSGGTTATAKDAPKTFEDAYDRAKDALASYNAAKLALDAAHNNNPEAVPELEEQMEQGKAAARQYFRAASVLVDDETDPKLVNEVRYFLCWLYWEAGDYYRAAVLGEFLARRHPDHPAAASAAKIAMASYERLFAGANAQGGSQADNDFEARRMAQIAEFIVRRWPDTEDAAAAQSVLVSFAIRDNRIDDAKEMLANASPETRLRLELQLGSAMWVKYLEAKLGDPKTRPDDATLAKMKEAAVKYLRSGYEAAKKGKEISEATANAALYLAQALLDDEKYDEAIALLETKKIGPLALIQQKHAATSRPQYAVEAYKAALRAYVLVTPPAADKALDMMSSMEDALRAAGATEEQVTQIYIGLGVNLQKQLEQLRDAGRDKDAARVAAAFAEFLERIHARQGDAKWPTRVWVAQMHYNLGVSQRAWSSSAPAGGAAREHLIQARDAYQKLLDEVAKNPQLAPSENATLAVKMQLGECYRALGEYKKALDTFSDILREKETSLAVQRAAAQTYQDWGQADDVQWLEKAIQGGYQLKSTGQNRIWGWLKISNVAARAARADQKYRDAFYEARLNVARCRYLAGMKRDGPARQQDLAKAKQSIQSLEQLYPDLGGERTRGEFDALLKQIQTAAGNKPIGLKEFAAGKPEPGPSTK